MIIGVLALQGDFQKHISLLHSMGIKAIEVKTPKQLEKCSGLVIPGGESTTISRSIDFIGLTAPLLTFAEKKPILGTCAGIILMAKFKLLDIDIERNAYGRQSESFTTDLDIPLFNKRCRSIFIRAPRITRCGASVEVIATFEKDPVFIKQGIHLGLTFHPELTNDLSIHQYFVELCKHALR